MQKSIPLFTRLEIETQSTCNRKCVWCIRNSNPDKEETAPWFKKSQLPIETIERIIDESLSLGFRGDVCLQHYNEPLMDERISDIVKLVKSKGISKVFFGSNADYLNKKVAESLDGFVDEIGFALYYDGEKFEKRKKFVQSLFKKTRVEIACGADDYKYPILTHYNPLVDDVEKIALSYSHLPCRRPLKRLIINHKGDMLMCCDDMTGKFGLGNINGSTVEELWYSEKHQRLVNALMHKDGRKVPGNEHCLTCPRN